MYLRALADDEKHNGEGYDNTLGLFHNLGNVYNCQGKLGEAKSTF